MIMPDHLESRACPSVILPHVTDIVAPPCPFSFHSNLPRLLKME